MERHSFCSFTATTGSNCSDLLSQIWDVLENSNVPIEQNLNLTSNLELVCFNSKGTNCSCSRFAPANFGHYCTSQTANAAQLLPPNCSSIRGTDFGWFDFPFLTWTVANYYENNGRGAMGGLQSSGLDEYSSWACIELPSCIPKGFVRGETACFKYSHVI